MERGPAAQPLLLAALALILLSGLLRVDGYAGGAPESICESGLIPAGHGIPRATHPYTITLLAEYTDVPVSSYRSDRNYDLQITAPSNENGGMAGFLIRDLNQSQPFAIAFPHSDSDHMDSVHAFNVSGSTILRCGGSAVTHSPSSNPNSTASVIFLRFTVRPPPLPPNQTSYGPWTFRFSIMGMPVRRDSTFYTLYPVNSTGALLERGEAHYFTRTFFPMTSPDPPTCGSSVVITCSASGTRDETCTGTRMASCSVPFADAVYTLDSSSLIIGGRNMVLRTDAAMGTILAYRETDTDFSRLTHIVTHGGAQKLLACGTGEGRPKCYFRNATTLERLGDPWFATGVIPRAAEIPWAWLTIGDLIYSARYQRGVPLFGNGVNVISASQISNTTGWIYRYREGSATIGANTNLLYRSTRVTRDDSRWLFQPASDQIGSSFVGAWTRNDSDPYVYFAFSEIAQDKTAVANRIARICKDEGNAAPPAFNQFASFVKMSISCVGTGDAAKSYALDQLTAVAASRTVQGSGEPFIYGAFKTRLGSPAGYGICAFMYTGRGGIDFEMSGRIDTKINFPGNFLENLSGNSFRCNRNTVDASKLTIVNNPQTDNVNYNASFAGEAKSNSVVFTANAAFTGASEFSHLYVDQVFAPGYDPVEVLWAVDTRGVLSKFYIDTNRTLNTRLVELVTVVPPADAALGRRVTSLTFSAQGGGSFIVGTNTTVVRVPLERCTQFLTCSSCVMAADPYCGWCSATSSCSRVDQCNAPGMWYRSLGALATASCAIPPAKTEPAARVDSATSVTISWAAAQAASSPGAFEAPRYDVLVDGEIRSGANGISGTQLVVSSLAPFTKYSVSVVARNSGGRALSSSVVDFTTFQAAPARLSAPTVRVDGVSQLSISWLPTTTANGVLRRYDLLRNGTRVCCTAGDLNVTFVDRVGLLPFTAYSYAVSAVTGGDPPFDLAGPASLDTTAVTSESTPGKPRAPTLVRATASSLEITWTPPDIPNGIIRQFALYKGSSGSSRIWRADESANITSYTAIGLEPYTLYSFAVEALTAAGPGPLSDTSTFRTQSGAPSRPLAPQASVVSSTQVNFTWSMPANDSNASPITKYELYLSVCGKTESGAPVFSGSATNFSVLGLIPCTTYCATVQAFTSAGAGPLSFVTSIQTASGSHLLKTEAPKLRGTPGNTFVTVEWNATECDLVGVVVRQKLATAPAFQTVCCAEPAPITNLYTASDLLPGTAYHFVLVKTYRLGGGLVSVNATTSDILTVTTSRDNAAPSSMDAPQLKSAGGSALTVKWTAPAQPNGNIIKFDLLRGDQVVCCDDGSLTEFQDEGLSPNTAFSYKVRAWNPTGAGAFSSLASFRTLIAAPPKPLPPTIAAVGTTSANVSFVAASALNGAITKYDIVVVGADGVSVVATLPLSANARAVQATGLQPGSAYYFRLVAYSSNLLMSTSDLSDVAFTQRTETLRPFEVESISFKMNRTWDQALATSGSPAFLALAALIKDKVGVLFRPISGQQEFNATKFTQGSVVVEGQLGSVSGPPIEDVLDLLKTAVESSTLGLGSGTSGFAVLASSSSCDPTNNNTNNNNNNGGNGNAGATIGESDSATTSALLGAVIALGCVCVLLGLSTFFFYRRATRALMRGGHSGSGSDNARGFERKSRESTVRLMNKSGFDLALTSFQDEAAHTESKTLERPQRATAGGSQTGNGTTDAKTLRRPHREGSAEEDGSSGDEVAGEGLSRDASGTASQSNPTLRRPTKFAPDESTGKNRMSTISQDSLFEPEDVVGAKVAEAMSARIADNDMKTIDFGSSPKKK